MRRVYLIGVRLLRIEAFVRYDARHGQVVGVADPADGVGVLAVTVRELCRTPAVDRLADELLRADQEAETDEDDDGVLSTQSVNVVVVDAELYLADAQHRFEELLHLRRVRRRGGGGGPPSGALELRLASTATVSTRPAGYLSMSRARVTCIPGRNLIDARAECVYVIPHRALLQQQNA